MWKAKKSNSLNKSCLMLPHTSMKRVLIVPLALLAVLSHAQELDPNYDSYAEPQYDAVGGYDSSSGYDGGGTDSSSYNVNNPSANGSASAEGSIQAIDPITDKATKPDSAPRTWRINLKEADIRAFIAQVAQITGHTFIVDQRIKGQVTVISSTPMTAEEVYSLLLTVLQINGYSAVMSGSSIKLIPNTTAKQENTPMMGTGSTKTSLVTRVVAIKNTPASELVPILRPLIPQYGHLAAVMSANALIISDHAENVKRILDLISKLDTAEAEQVEVVQLKDAWVGDVLALLESLEPVETQVKKSPIESGGLKRVTVVAEERTNRLIIKGERSARARLRALIQSLDQPSRRTGKTKVVQLRHAKAVKVAEIVKGLIDGGSGQAASKAGGNTQGVIAATKKPINIQPDESLNAIVVQAEPSDLIEIEELIKQLDVRRAQVLIEAAIVEISGDVSRALGVQWASLDADNGPTGAINFSNVGVSVTQVIGALQGATTGASLGDGITIAGGEDKGGNKGYGVILQALSKASNANLLSTPSIMTLDNEEAEIVVGQNVPFVTGSVTSGANSTANPFQTISREDVGLKLKVLPQISEGNVIRLQVEQEVSEVDRTSSTPGSSDLITNKRAIKTTILADNGGTIVLGGLIRDKYNESESKVPILGDIPWLGRLFKSSNKFHEKSNLLVFLQPKIIRDGELAGKVTEDKYRYVRGVEIEVNSSGLFKGRSIELQKEQLPESIKKVYR